MPPEQLAHEPLGRLPVAPALYQHIEHRAVLVLRAPQPVLPAVDSDEHFIEVPLIASGQGGGANPPGNAQAKPYRPALHRLVGQLDAARGQQLLNHAQAQGETVVQPHRIADHLGWEAVTGIGNGVAGRYGGSFHIRD